MDSEIEVSPNSTAALK